jgi:hypothetical protein
MAGQAQKRTEVKEKKDGEKRQRQPAERHALTIKPIVSRGVL